MIAHVFVLGTALVAVPMAVGLWERRRSGGSHAMPRLDADPSPLSEAASLAYGYAQERRLPLAVVADRKGGAQWFADSMLKTVPVSATCLKSGRLIKLAAGTHVMADAGGLARHAASEPAYHDPVIGRRAFRAYLRWMTSVW